MLNEDNENNDGDSKEVIDITDENIAGFDKIISEISVISLNDWMDERSPGQKLEPRQSIQFTSLCCLWLLDLVEGGCQTPDLCSCLKKCSLTSVFPIDNNNNK